MRSPCAITASAAPPGRARAAAARWLPRRGAVAGVPLASLPSVDALLRSPGGDALIAAHGRAPVTGAVREVLAGLRSSRTPLDEPAILARVKAIVEERSQPTLRAVFNLTGTVLHTNLGR